jgi:hypothetical protein
MIFGPSGADLYLPDFSDQSLALMRRSFAVRAIRNRASPSPWEHGARPSPVSSTPPTRPRSTGRTGSVGHSDVPRLPLDREGRGHHRCPRNAGPPDDLHRMDGATGREPYRRSAGDVPAAATSAACNGGWCRGARRHGCPGPRNWWRPMAEMRTVRSGFTTSCIHRAHPTTASEAETLHGVQSREAGKQAASARPTLRMTLDPVRERADVVRDRLWVCTRGVPQAQGAFRKGGSAHELSSAPPTRSTVSSASSAIRAMAARLSSGVPAFAYSALAASTALRSVISSGSAPCSCMMR